MTTAIAVIAGMLIKKVRFEETNFRKLLRNFGKYFVSKEVCEQ